MLFINSMKLGTHNSLSYLPCQWYLIPFAWIGKCQSKTISEQYELGVRWFDIRVKYANGKPVSGHGLLTYDVNIPVVLNFLNNRKDCIVRLFLENTKRNPTKDFDRFTADIKNWKRSFPGIRFVEGGCRYQYRQFIDDNISVRHCYWQKGMGLPIPRLWAKKHNYQLHHGDSEIEFSVYDFIQY